MNKRATAPEPATKTLAEQKVDFTAEGSPPPGKVSTSLPVSPPEPDKTSRPSVPARTTIRLKRTPPSAKP